MSGGNTRDARHDAGTEEPGRGRRVRRRTGDGAPLTSPGTGRPDRKDWDGGYQDSGGGLWVSDHEHRIVHVNRSFCRIAGVGAEELEGKSLLTGFGVEKMRFFLSRYLEAQETLHPVYYHAVPLVTPSGRQTLQSGWLMPRVENGKFRGMVCTVDEVTERHRPPELNRAIQDMLLDLAATDSPGQARKTCLKAALKATRMDGGAIYQPAEGGGFALAQSMGLPGGAVKAFGGLRKGTTGWSLIMAGQPVYAALEDFRVLMGLDGEPWLDFRAVGAAPVIHGEGIPGLVLVFSREDYQLPLEARFALELVAEMMGGALARLAPETVSGGGEEALEELVAQSPAILYRMRPGGNPPVLFMAGAVEELTGYTPGDFRDGAVSLDDLVVRDDRLHFWEDDFQAWRKGSVVPLEYRIARPDGDTRWVLDLRRPSVLSGGGGAILDGVLVDITRRKEAEEKLAESEQRHRRVLTGMNEGLALFDARRRVTFVNSRLAEMLGRGMERLTGRDLRDMLEPELGPDSSLRLEEALTREPGRPQDPVEIELVLPDGRVNHFRVSPRIIMGPDGSVQGGLVVFTDVTESHRYAQKLQAQAQSLEETNTALKVLLEHRQQEKRGVEESVAASVARLIEPYLERLSQTRLSQDQLSLLEIVRENLKEITSPFARRLSQNFVGLSSQELKVAGLVRDGRTTKEIAELLCISENAVAFHRKNVRTKLGIKQRKVNLHSYLQNMLRE